jgi:hypothetical protein
VLRGVSNEQRQQIAALPKPDREILAGGFLTLLGFTAVELWPIAEESIGAKKRAALDASVEVDDVVD